MNDTNKNILVTVICTTYNQVDYVEQCIRSLATQQTSFAYEVIVHDDASTDGTADIIHRLAKEYTNIVPILQSTNQYSQGKHPGTLAAKEAHGKYIALCEGDDFWSSPHKLELQASYMEQHPQCTLCVHAASILDDREGLIVGTTSLGDEERDVSIQDIIGSPHGGGIFATNSMMMTLPMFMRPKEYLLWAGVGDYPMNIYCALNGDVHYLPDNLSVYRQNARGSWSQTMKKNKDVAIQRRQDLITCLWQFDERTGKQYHECVCEAVYRNQAELSVIKRQWQELKQGAVGEWVSRQPLKERGSLWMRCHLSERQIATISYVYRHLKNGIRKTRLSK